MGSEGIRISIYAIIFLSVAILFFPVQQGYGIFTLPELSEQELIELYKLEQRTNAEHARDELFVLLRVQNPYLDTPLDIKVSYERNGEENIPKVIDRYYENFQTIKDEQISIAEKKCKEILGGKTISNLVNDEPLHTKTTHEFKIDNQIGSMERNDEGFQNYRILQISIAEEFRDNNWQENLWLSNPYQNNESIEVLSNNEENKILELSLNYRQSEEFKNLIIEQIFLAENIRNEMLDFRVTGVAYTYLDENVDENMDESLGKTNTSIIISWSDPTYVTDKLEFNIIDRNAKEFEMVKAMELEIAQNTLNEMYLLSNSEDDVEIIILTQENKKPNNYGRYDKGFEFFKNKQIEIAEKKLMEILGQKNIHNSDYLDFEKIKIKYYSYLDKK